MEAIKVGIREFRNKLPHYLLEAGQPVAVTRHGATVGYFIPSRDQDPIADIDGLRVAAAKLDAMLKLAEIDVNQLATEFTAKRRRK